MTQESIPEDQEDTQKLLDEDQDYQIWLDNIQRSTLCAMIEEHEHD